MLQNLLTKFNAAIKDGKEEFCESFHVRDEKFENKCSAILSKPFLHMCHALNENHVIF